VKNLPPALAFERLLLHPRAVELVEQFRALAPAGFVDQADAATAEALRLMAGAGAAVLGADEVEGVAVEETPEWLRLGLLDAFAGWVTGQAATCRHQPAAERPRPVLAAAWKPGLVVCQACAHLTALPRGRARDRTCDACGRECAGLDHGDGIYPGLAQIGPLVYQYGTCGDCRPAESHAAPRSRPAEG